MGWLRGGLERNAESFEIMFGRGLGERFVFVMGGEERGRLDRAVYTPGDQEGRTDVPAF
jgi:hypothetical protein